MGEEPKVMLLQFNQQKMKSEWIDKIIQLAAKANIILIPTPVFDPSEDIKVINLK